MGANSCHAATAFAVSPTEAPLAPGVSRSTAGCHHGLPRALASSAPLREPVASGPGLIAAAGSAAVCCAIAYQKKTRSQLRKEKRLQRAVALKAKKGEDDGVSYTDTILLPQTDFSQRGMAKTREPELQAFWRDEKIYEELLNRPAPNGAFTLHDGPPYANGNLHMGHALNKILKDSINKFKVSQGYKVKYIPGWDCHGLPIELKVLQSLKSKERRGLTPIELRKKAASFALETVESQRKAFERYGVWGEFENPYLTLKPEYEAAQLRVFEEMVRGGHIYRGRKPVYWSPSTRTALAEAELEYPAGHISQSIYVGFKCSGEAPAALAEALNGATSVDDLEVAVWTTTPWTIPANRAVAVNPELDYAVAKATFADGKTRRLVIAEGLAESLKATLKLESLEIETKFKGGVLEGLVYKHPLTGVEMKVLEGGSYITTESGTGLVHTAPGHGADDYNVGMKYNLEVAAPVDDAGNFTAEVGVESLVGANVLKDANDKVIALLQESDHLLMESPYSHKYPYDWRSKKPVITRATPQWFCSIDGIREQTLSAMDKVQFIPEAYHNRMRPMIVGRSDWCISRQRSWGLPIPAFYREDTGEALLTPEIVSHVREIVKEKGSNAWFELSVEELLPEPYKKDASLYTKGRDTMDVWFDSGSSWAAVEEELGSPVDLYLEGQDQHRGWFQSSLITSVAVKGKAPYKSVMTHGFCVDGNGRKMSKSIGNVMDPYTIIEGGGDTKKEPPYGADVLRLWVASVDFSGDVAISQEIMGLVGENVRKMRNRIRFLLGNIHDFDPATDAVAYADLPLLDRRVIRQAETVVKQMTELYDTYTFSQATKALVNFMQELSAFYLDVAKDRLYIDAKDSRKRRSSQTVLRWLCVTLARVMSPVLCHLGEDVWQNLRKLPRGDELPKSVFLADWCPPFPKGSEDGDAVLEEFEKVLSLRDPANMAMEKARRGEVIGSALEAAVTIQLAADSPVKAALESLKSSPQPDVDDLRRLLGVSSVEIKDAAADASGEEAEALAGDLKAHVSATKSAGRKCERCWLYSDFVGRSEAHSCLCERCVSVVEAIRQPEATPA
eukprot:TRINITY_DN90523_c0_g1_i1.p1 TRINITY_DN90523_c0_g1~~TRINITY_DN90523_c0_g1_i1.p1  ORF type:complete len:1072 (-),score=311.55 TRINITY_DN90523_c0_g1_i1:209-3424(-)